MITIVSAIGLAIIVDMERNDPLLNGKIREHMNSYQENSFNITEFALMSHAIKNQITEDI